MKLKSYFAPSVEAAMETARGELGEDALLINAKPAAGVARALGAVEVVFGVVQQRSGPKPKPALPSSRSAAARSSTPSKNAVQRLDQTGSDRSDHSADIASLRQEVERISQALRAVTISSTARQVKHPELYQELIESEMDADLARHIADGASLEELLLVDATIGGPDEPRSVAAFVGPPGVGKTTTLVKLAARYGLASRRPAHIISTDVHRIAAADQLRVLASILGIGCTVVETARTLAQALEEHRNKEFVFIDTPGLAAGEVEDCTDLADLIAEDPEIDTHLLVPASMKARDLATVIDRHEIFAPGKLLFTRLDETNRFGALISESIHRRMPVSFLSTGQQIPDHLEPATKQNLAALIHRGSSHCDSLREIPAADSPAWRQNSQPMLKRRAAGAAAGAGVGV